MGANCAAALKMPSNYVVMDVEEMTYTEGGQTQKTYSGAEGWAAAAALGAVGVGMAAFGGKTIQAAIPIIIGMTAGGPIGWVAAGITSVIGAAGLGTIVYFGNEFASAGKQAAYYMGTKGEFTLKLNDNPFGLISVY